MDEERTFQVSLPLDSDGFLRRACPTCEREFKWLSRPEENPDDGPESYYCPYCGVQAPSGEWFTEAQLARIHAILMAEVVGPQLEEFGDSLKRIGRNSGGLISVSMETKTPEPPVEQTVEEDDMRRVDFACHPDEPVKIADERASVVYCLTCGLPQNS